MYSRLLRHFLAVVEHKGITSAADELHISQPALTKSIRQLEDNLGALDVALSDDQRARLEAASAVVMGFPHDMLSRPLTRAVMFGEVKIAPRV